jgi:hypothetical protein
LSVIEEKPRVPFQTVFEMVDPGVGSTGMNPEGRVRSTGTRRQISRRATCDIPYEKPKKKSVDKKLTKKNVKEGPKKSIEQRNLECTHQLRIKTNMNIYTRIQMQRVTEKSMRHT